jgi:uncharacterized membrane protein YbhN (UPF0104 family)
LGILGGDGRRGAQRWHRLVAAVLTVAVLAVLAQYLYTQRDHVAANYAFAPGTLLTLIGLVVLTLALRALIHQLLFGRLGVAAPLRDWFAVVTVNSFANYLPLSAGLAAKAFYLKRVHAMPYRRFAIGQTALLLLVVATHGCVGLAAVLIWRPVAGGWIAAAFAAMAACGGLFWLPDRVTRHLGDRWASWSAQPISQLRGCVLSVMGVQIGVLLVAAWSLKLGFSTGHTDVSLAACVVFSAVAVLTRLVSVTPGAVGVREFLIGGLAVLTGFELQDAVIASVITRVAEMVAIFTLGGVFTFTLSKRIATTYDEDRGPTAD